MMEPQQPQYQRDLMFALCCLVDQLCSTGECWAPDAPLPLPYCPPL